MKKLNLIIAILLLFPVKVFCQEMSVQSFYLAETDMTANIKESLRRDQGGDLCALIKVETSVDGFNFDTGMLGVTGDVERVGGELWVYVPASVKKMTISHAQLGVIREYKLPVSLSPGRTYIMKLVSGNVRTIVDYAPTRQFLYVEINPKDAIFELDGKIKATDDGVYQEMLPFGKYQYRAYTQNYYEESGVIEISDPDNPHNLSLNLRAAFGHLSILENAAKENVGAAVYLDDKYIGRIPVKDVQLSSGTYRLRVIKEMYEVYNEIVEISDGCNRLLRPSLVPDFAEVTLVTGEGFDIYINGEHKGKTSWKGSLATGSYLFETRKKGYVPYKASYDITKNDHAKTIQVQEPTPLYGSLVISSAPAKAKIYIDGQYAGNTPKLISKQLVGDYSISVKLDGYLTQKQSVTINEGQESNLSFTLKELPALVSTHTMPAQDKYAGYTAHSINMKDDGSLDESYVTVKYNHEHKRFNTSRTLDAAVGGTYVLTMVLGDLEEIKLDQVLSWEFSNPEIADVKKGNGKLLFKPKTFGNTILNAKVEGGKDVEFHITVMPCHFPHTKSLKADESLQLETGYNWDAAFWMSEDENVATVTSTGMLTAHKSGKTVVWTASKTGVVEKFEIEVTAPAKTSASTALSTSSASRELSINSIALAENDMTANILGAREVDSNGNVCALIKVETTLDNLTFDVGMLGIVKCERVGNEIWVYVPYGIRKITIRHPQFGILRDYPIPFAIEKGRTYKMKLSI